MVIVQRPPIGSAARAPRRWPFWAVAYSYLVLLAGTNVPSPLYRGYEHELGFSPLVVTLSFASYVAALIPALLLIGPLSDAAGRRRVLLAALALAVAGSVLFAVADATAWLYAARCVQGVAVGAGSGAIVAALSELEPAGDHRRAALVATVAPVGGIAVAPLLSGLLAQYLPGPHLVPYLVEIALLLPAIAAIAMGPEPLAARSRWRPRRPQVPPHIRAAFATSAASSFHAWAVTGLFLALVPSYLATLTGTTNLAIAGGVVTLMLGCSAAAQRVGYARAPRPLQAGGLAVLTAGLLVLIAAGAYASIALLLAATVVAGTGQGLAFLGAMTEINRIAPADRRADIVSSFLVVTYLGTGLPVIGAGVVATTVGLLPAVQYFAAVVAALCLPLLAILARAGRRVRLAAAGKPRAMSEHEERDETREHERRVAEEDPAERSPAGEDEPGDAAAEDDPAGRDRAPDDIPPGIGRLEK